MKHNLFKFLLVVVALVGCDKGGEIPPGGSANSGETPAANNCTFVTPAVGKKVLFTGTQGASSAKFTSDSRDYVGTVLTVFNNGTAQVEWPDISDNTVESFSVIAPEGTCSPSLTGKRAVFTGTQGASSVDFTSESRSYVGTIVTVFAGGRVEIDWDHLSYNTAESFAVIALEQ